MGTLKLSITEEIDITYGGFTYNYTTSGASDDLEIGDVDAYNAPTSSAISAPTDYDEVFEDDDG